MKLRAIYIIIFVFSIVFLTNCNNKKENNTDNSLNNYKLKYAKGFEIFYFKDYTKLIVKSPFHNSDENYEYILSNNKINGLKSIKTPIKSLVVTSTTHIPILELLNAEKQLVGFPNTKYVSSEKTRELIENGSIQDLGNEEDINTEMLLDLNSDIIVGFSISGNTKMYSNIEKMGIPVIFNGDWLEKTPLGRAEWIKFFGVLLGKEKMADSIFNSIEKSYLRAKQIALKSKKIPTVISGGLFKDIWNLPAGESFEATLLKDANIDYLWKNTQGNGSLSLNIESVFEKGKDADIWISPSYYSSINQLKEANTIYSEFKAFKDKKVYSYVNKKGRTGGLIYFEKAPIKPDLVLMDLIKIAHPDLLEDYKLTFYELLE